MIPPALCGGRKAALTLALLVTVLAPSTGRAQEPPANPQTAEASVELEELIVRDRIESDATMVRRERTVARLLTPAAVAQYAQVGVPFFESNQQADVEVLRIVKPDGREIDALPSAPRDVAPLLPPELPMHSDLRLLRLAVPSLAVGDRVVLETHVVSRPIAEGHVWSEHTFPRGVEIASQLYELDLPADSALVVHLRSGLDAELEETREHGRWVRRWRPKAAAAAAEDDAATEPSEVEPQPDVQVTSFADWQAFGRWWASLAPPEIGRDVRAKAKELTAGLAGDEQKLRALERFVARDVRYFALPLGLGRYRAREPGEVLATGFGDCKDKHRLLASLAKVVGIEVESVLINASGRELVEGAPSPLQFDHVISRARLGEQVLWMDATSEMTPAGSLTANLRDVRAAVASGESVELVTTPAELPFETVNRSETTGEIGADGTIRARVRWTFVGDDELLRLAFKYVEPENRSDLIAGFRHEWSRKQSQVGAFSNGDPDELGTPFWIEYEIEWPMKATVWAKAWDLWLPVPELGLEKPPSDGGTEDLQFESPRRQLRIARLEVPAGVVVTPPVPVRVQRDFADYRSEYRFEGRTLVVERELVRKASAIPPEKFPELEAFLQLIADDRKQQFDFAAAPHLAPEPVETADDLNSRCRREIGADRYAQAVDLCRRAVELEPEHRYAWNNLGDALIELDRVDEAEAALQRQIEIDPNDRYAYANLGRVAWHRRDHLRAEELMRRQIEIAPLEAYPYAGLGRLLLRREEAWPEAEESLKRALKLNADDSDAVADLFWLYGRSRNASALVALAAAHPDLPRSLAARANAAAALLGTAARPVGKWQSLAPWVDRLATGAEQALAGIEDAKPTLEQLRGAFALAAAWELRGRMALESEQFDEAISLLAGSLRMTPTAATAGLLAEALFGAGRAEEANLQLAIATELERGAGDYQARLAERVPSPAERRTLASRARDEAFKLRSFTRRTPAAAKTEGVLWLLFDRDGRLLEAAPKEAGGPRALADSLKLDAPSLALPAANHARVPIGALAHCDAAGECTVVLMPPGQSWSELEDD